MKRNMKKQKRVPWIFAGVLAVFALMAAGCIQVETDVLVRSDGSAVVSRTFLMKEEFVQMVAAMQGENEFSLMDEEELRGSAGEMGRGVQYSGARELKKEGFSGYVAEYFVEDINTLRLNQNPGDSMPAGTMDSPPVDEMIKFNFTPGRQNLLEIDLPKKDMTAGENTGSQPSGQGGNDQFVEEFMKIYGDMRITMQVRIDGTIQRTNASYRKGDTVTLMDIEFGKIVDDRQAMDDLAALRPETLEEMKRIIGDTEGISVELEDRVEIHFTSR